MIILQKRNVFQPPIQTTKHILSFFTMSGNQHLAFVPEVKNTLDYSTLTQSN